MKPRPIHSFGVDNSGPVGPLGAGRACAAIACLLLLAACGFDGVTETPRAAAETADVTLIFRTDSLAEAAALLGWGEVIPDVEITVQRTGLPTDPPPITARTDAEGVVRLEAMAVGLYRVSLTRKLTLDEFELVRETGVTGVADAFPIVVTGPTSEFELAPAPALRGGLMISEYHFPWFYRLGVGNYPTSGFLELYNNSDATVYLDGKLVGSLMDLVYDATPCDWTARFRTDPVGVWPWEIQRLPGTGHDYPLEPGETVVIATDAIDHSEFIDDLLDLSEADFEFSGPTGPDNPGIPNMINVGDFTSPLGHGIIFNSLRGLPFVADTVNLDALPRDRVLETTTWDMHRIPGTRLLDVVAFYSTHPGINWCDPFVHPNFNRAPGQYILDEGESWLTSINRKVAFHLPDGRAVLQHTRNSARDFSIGERTPGWIPE